MRTIKFNCSYEDIITRIPGLFAYIETDEIGNSVLHKATDSPMGCYGKIVENISVPFGIKIGEDNIIQKDASYPFKYLMRLYYENKDDKENYGDLINFIERGIGKIKVDYPNLNREENDLVPTYIYLANVNVLYEEMLELKSACNFYEQHKENKKDYAELDFETEQELCCKCMKFKRKGGEGMLEFLFEHLEEAQNIADEYYENYVSEEYDEEHTEYLRLTNNFNINLFTSERDLGVLTPLTIEKTLDEKVSVLFENIIKLDNKEALITSFSELAPINENKIEELFNNKDTEGIIRLLIELLYPIADKDIKESYLNNLTEKITSSKDSKEKAKALTEGILYQKINQNFQTDSKLTQIRRFKNYINFYGEEEKPLKDCDWLFFYRKNCVCNLSYLSDKNGNIARESDSYDGIEVGKEVEDLLAYGDVIQDITVNNADFTITFTYITDAHLKAKVKQIEEDEDKNKKIFYEDFTIDETGFDNGFGIKYIETYTFEEGSEIDEFSKSALWENYITGKYDDFQKLYDIFYSSDYEDAEIGIVDFLNEEDIKEGDGCGKFEKLDGTDFNNSEIIYIDEVVNLIKYGKLEFSLINSIQQTTKIINGEKIILENVISPNTAMNVIRQISSPLLSTTEISRVDFYEGVTYSPTEKVDININRGITSIFEQHLRFAEIKTLEDMEEGSFFKIQSTN